MMALVGLYLAIVTTVSWLVLVYQIARFLLPEAGPVPRGAATLVLLYWLAASGFQVLALSGHFKLWWVAGIGVVLPCFLLMAWKRRLDRQDPWLTAVAREEWRPVLAELKEHRWIALGIGAVGAHLLVRMARTLATPAFGWDDFTYHLFRAGRWVQNGGLVLEPAPDAWTYYEYFPWGGDLLWAWAMVWGTGDTLVPVVAILLWLSVLILGYAVAMELQASRLTGLTVALAIAALPSQAGQLSTAYVDNAVLLMVLGASLFLLRYLDMDPDATRQRVVSAFLIGCCLGLGVLIKMSFLPFLIPAAFVVGWPTLRHRRWRDGLALVGGFAVAIPNLVFNGYHRGSPFYPFQIVDCLPFNEQHSWILGKYGVGATPAELGRAAKALLFNLFPLDPFLNFGVLGLALLCLGLMGAVVMVRTARGRWFLLWVGSGAVLTTVTFFSPRNSSMIVWWTLMMGRFLVPGLAGLFVLSALAPRYLLRGLLVPLLVGEYFLYARRGWPVEQTVATLQVIALAGLVYMIASISMRNRQRWQPKVATILVAGLALFALIGVREGYRFEAYRLFAERRLQDFHGAPPVEAWPIWRRLDEIGPVRVAATAGFDGMTGHNWFRAPLLGAFLQNQVVYVPVTRDGSVISYRDRSALVRAADLNAWLSRLQAQDIDQIVALGPANIEHRWILDLPSIFEIEISMGYDHFLLARIDKQALARYLAAGGLS